MVALFQSSSVIIKVCRFSNLMPTSRPAKWWGASQLHKAPDEQRALIENYCSAYHFQPCTLIMSSVLSLEAWSGACLLDHTKTLFAPVTRTASAPRAGTSAGSGLEISAVASLPPCSCVGWPRLIKALFHILGHALGHCFCPSWRFVLFF